MEREKQRDEAIRRLKILQDKGLHENVIKEFLEDETLYYSENLRTSTFKLATLYWVSNKDEMVEAVRSFEEEKGAFVYHVIESLTVFGKLWSFLYVSKHEEEWEKDREELEEMAPFVYVHNCDDDFCSEFGSIGIELSGGGVYRRA